MSLHVHISSLVVRSYFIHLTISCFNLCFCTENKRKVEMIEHLKRRGYASDPVKAWKQSISEREEEEEEEGSDEESSSANDQADYNYLLSMQLWSLTREKKDELLKNKDKKVGRSCALLSTHSCIEN